MGRRRHPGVSVAMPSETHIDKPLLELIQARFPLVRQPYAQVAAEIGCGEQELLARLKELRGTNGIIREISAIFSAFALGYSQSLIALQQGQADLDKAGRIVSEHPGVSHCYERDGRYNLWFTLAVSPQSCFGLAGTVEVLARATGAEAKLILPAIKRYKLRFDPGFLSDNGPDRAISPETLDREQPPALTDAMIRSVRSLQKDLPNQQDPFAVLARKSDLDPDMLLVHAADLLAGGYMRRYAAVLHHRRAGAQANVMVAWLVETSSADRAGAEAARFPAVSHCYIRETCEDWPYALYTMIHGSSRENCLHTIDRIASATGLSDRQELWTLKEYKKQRVRFFTGGESAWEGKAERR